MTENQTDSRFEVTYALTKAELKEFEVFQNQHPDYRTPLWMRGFWSWILPPLIVPVLVALIFGGWLSLCFFLVIPGLLVYYWYPRYRPYEQHLEVSSASRRLSGQIFDHEKVWNRFDGIEDTKSLLLLESGGILEAWPKRAFTAEQLDFIRSQKEKFGKDPANGDLSVELFDEVLNAEPWARFSYSLPLSDVEYMQEERMKPIPDPNVEKAKLGISFWLIWLLLAALFVSAFWMPEAPKPEGAGERVKIYPHLFTGLGAAVIWLFSIFYWGRFLEIRRLKPLLKRFSRSKDRHFPKNYELFFLDNGIAVGNAKEFSFYESGSLAQPIANERLAGIQTADNSIIAIPKSTFEDENALNVFSERVRQVIAYVAPNHDDHEEDPEQLKNPYRSPSS